MLREDRPTRAQLLADEHPAEESPARQPSGTVDLLEALQRSVDAARAARREASDG